MNHQQLLGELFELLIVSCLTELCNRRRLVVVWSLSHVRLFVTSWAVAGRAPLSMGFPGQEYWSELPFSSPGDLPELHLFRLLPTLASRFFTTGPPGKPLEAL